MAEEDLDPIEMGGVVPSGDSNLAAHPQGEDVAGDPTLMDVDPMDTTEQNDAGHSDEDSTRDFIDMIDFYKTSKIADFSGISNHVSDFVQAYEAINQGCGCSKKNRIALAEQKYLNLANLDEEGKNTLKGKLNAEKVRLFHQSGLFSEF
jgi:hypothetical protein